jgi:predicted RNA-binding protein associated with RNAse of E/G family
VPVSYPAILERKIKPDGTVREYPCRLVHMEPGFAVIRYTIQHGGSIFGTPIEVPPDTISFGYFWKRRPYSIYRMKGPAGQIIAHRFDASTVVAIEPAAITYRDLVLDWWITPDGTIIEEDLDEFEAMVADNRMTPRDHRLAMEAAAQVLGRYRHIIDELAVHERRLGLD